MQSVINVNSHPVWVWWHQESLQTWQRHVVGPLQHFCPKSTAPAPDTAKNRQRFSQNLTQYDQAQFINTLCCSGYIKGNLWAAYRFHSATPLQCPLSFPLSLDRLVSDDPTKAVWKYTNRCKVEIDMTYNLIQTCNWKNINRSVELVKQTERHVHDPKYSLA